MCDLFTLAFWTMLHFFCTLFAFSMVFVFNLEDVGLFCFDVSGILLASFREVHQEARDARKNIHNVKTAKHINHNRGNTSKHRYFCRSGSVAARTCHKRSLVAFPEFQNPLSSLCFVASAVAPVCAVRFEVGKIWPLPARSKSKVRNPPALLERLRRSGVHVCLDDSGLEGCRFSFWMSARRLLCR